MADDDDFEFDAPKFVDIARDHREILTGRATTDDEWFAEPHLQHELDGVPPPPDTRTPRTRKRDAKRFFAEEYGIDFSSENSGESDAESKGESSDSGSAKQAAERKSSESSSRTPARSLLRSRARRIEKPAKTSDEDDDDDDDEEEENKSGHSASENDREQVSGLRRSRDEGVRSGGARRILQGAARRVSAGSDSEESESDDDDKRAKATQRRKVSQVTNTNKQRTSRVNFTAAPSARNQGTKRPKVSSEDVFDDEMRNMLAKHNKKFKKKVVYVHRCHKMSEYRKWEEQTGKKWNDLSMEEREEANEEIQHMKRQGLL